MLFAPRLRMIAVLSLPLLALAGCFQLGDDGNDEIGATETGTTDETTGTTDGTTDTTDTTETTTDTTDTTETTTDTTDTTDTTETTDGGCQLWEIRYNLDGSAFEISNTPLGAGDQLNLVGEPYGANDRVGPGLFVLHFQDVNGQPGGAVAMVYYQMSMHFVVSGSPATISTDLENDAGPEPCGLSNGLLEGNIVDWSPSAIVGHHSVGEILCMGFGCGLVGMPNGTPVPQDETSDQPLSLFVFSDDLTSFDMEPTVITMDQNATTSWAYHGTEISRELKPAPDCLCP